MTEKDKESSKDMLLFDYGAPDIENTPLGAVYVDIMKMENIADLSTIKQKASKAVEEIYGD